MIIGPRSKKGFYPVDDAEYLSVTNTIARCVPMPTSIIEHYYCKLGWDNAVADREDKAEIGIVIHDALELWFFSSPPKPNEQWQGVIDQVADFYESEHIKPMLGEMRLGSHKEKTAGQSDFIGIIDHFKDIRIPIIDYKSGSPNSFKEAVQQGIYGKMFIETQDRFNLPFKAKFEQLVGWTVYTGREPNGKIPKPRSFSNNQLKLGAQAFGLMQKQLELQDKFKILTKENKKSKK